MWLALLLVVRITFGDARTTRHAWNCSAECLQHRVFGGPNDRPFVILQHGLQYCAGSEAQLSLHKPIRRWKTYISYERVSSRAAVATTFAHYKSDIMDPSLTSRLESILDILEMQPQPNLLPHAVRLRRIANKARSVQTSTIDAIVRRINEEKRTIEDLIGRPAENIEALRKLTGAVDIRLLHFSLCSTAEAKMEDKLLSYLGARSLALEYDQWQRDMSNEATRLDILKQNPATDSKRMIDTVKTYIKHRHRSFDTTYIQKAQKAIHFGQSILLMEQLWGDLSISSALWTCAKQVQRIDFQSLEKLKTQLSKLDWLRQLKNSGWFESCIRQYEGMWPKWNDTHHTDEADSRLHEVTPTCDIPSVAPALPLGLTPWQPSTIFQSPSQICDWAPSPGLWREADHDQIPFTTIRPWLNDVSTTEVSRPGWSYT
jgi:hypothetical protein